MIWSLACAEDIVLVTKNREALTDMMDTLKILLKEKALELNVDKTKIYGL